MNCTSLEAYFNDIQVSICLPAEYQDYDCFGEVSIFVMPKVSK
jgi:hypothetical protein